MVFGSTKILPTNTVFKLILRLPIFFSGSFWKLEYHIVPETPQAATTYFYLVTVINNISTL